MKSCCFNALIIKGDLFSNKSIEKEKLALLTNIIDKTTLNRLLGEVAEIFSRSSNSLLREENEFISRGILHYIARDFMRYRMVEELLFNIMLFLLTFQSIRCNEQIGMRQILKNSVYMLLPQHILDNPITYMCYFVKIYMLFFSYSKYVFIYLSSGVCIFIIVVVFTYLSQIHLFTFICVFCYY